MTDWISEIGKERGRQVSEEGWTPEHDDEHDGGELSMAAACYAAARPLSTFNPDNGCFDDAWPWHPSWDKRHKHSRRRQLVIAGALIVAELERLERAGD